jgi:hypothetical protein
MGVYGKDSHAGKGVLQRGRPNEKHHSCWNLSSIFKKRTGTKVRSERIKSLIDMLYVVLVLALFLYGATWHNKSGGNGATEGKGGH